MTQLQKARDYEALHRPQIKPQLPIYHLTGGVGWINDPNGFAPYRGEYHLFFQYHPYDTQWGPMHWGHAKTADFIRWEFLPAALAPEDSYDKDGCFSGGRIGKCRMAVISSFTPVSTGQHRHSASPLGMA